MISESSWLLRYSNVRFKIPRLHPPSPSWHRNLRRRRALARLSLARGKGTSVHVARLRSHHGSCPPMTAKWVCQCGVMHPSHHEWCSCGKYRSHGIQLAGGGGGQRSSSRKRRQFSKASVTVEPWTCTVCSQEVTTKACNVCGLRKSYLAAAQHVKSEKVTPNHAIKPALRAASRPQVPPGTGALEFYKKQLKALQTMRKNANCLGRHCSYGLSGTKDCSIEAAQSRCQASLGAAFTLWCRPRKRKG